MNQKSTYMTLLNSTSQNEPLFYAKLWVKKHGIKKNSKRILYNRGTGRPFITSNQDAKSAENEMVFTLTRMRSEIEKTIDEDIEIEFIFTFKDYYTKKGERRKTIPDLSNLYELPQDALQKSGIINNDTQICSHDGSRRKPGKENTLEITIKRFQE